MSTGPSGDTIESFVHPGAKKLWDEVLRYRRELGHAELGVHHWLAVALSLHAQMVRAISPDVDPAALGRRLREDLAKGAVGAALSEGSMLSAALESARARGNQKVAEFDLIAAALTAFGMKPPASAKTAAPATSGPAGAPLPGADGQAASATPALDQFGRDLTREAADGRLGEVIGREAEIALVIETLGRRTKRNPMLLGLAGVGKTAIVEGLALRIANGQVPDFLKGHRVVALAPSSLTAGAGVMGEFEKRMKGILEEAKRNAILLFIDEAHAIIGAGGRPGTGDLASILKPVLARGEIVCIAATTDEEYRREIEPDAALERRFQPIRVQELGPADTLLILKSVRDGLHKSSGVAVADDVLAWLVSFAHRTMKNRQFPDKAIDLLEQCVAHARAVGEREVTDAGAHATAERVVGIPADLSGKLSFLRQRLADLSLLDPDGTEALVNRLEVTTRGLDMRIQRPNAIVILRGPAAAASEPLARTISESLFGAASRVVTIEFGQFLEAHDLTGLLGAPPAYVGFDRPIPLNLVAQMPFCVLRLENVDGCHPAVREVLVHALSDGYFTTSAGRRIYLSDTIVLMTARGGAASTRAAVGFHAAEQRAVREEVPADDVLSELIEQADAVCSEILSTGDARRRWVKDSLLAGLTDRFSEHGVALTFDESVVDWLARLYDAGEVLPRWEKTAEERIARAVLPHLADTHPGAPKHLLVKYADGNISLEKD